jgi:hypothetical protein
MNSNIGLGKLLGSVVGISPPDTIALQGTQGGVQFMGFQGVQSIGIQGMYGVESFYGRFGFQGYQGFQGFQGFQGCQDFQGFQGRQGHQGFQGIQGEIGYQGFQNYDGFEGYQSRIGVDGFRGSQGFQGNQGEGLVYATSWLYPTVGGSIASNDQYLYSFTNTINSVSWLSGSTTIGGSINSIGTYMIELTYCMTLTQSGSLVLSVMVTDPDNIILRTHHARTVMTGTSGNTVFGKTSFGVVISTAPQTINILKAGPSFTYATLTGNAPNSYLQTSIRVTKLN